jgi:pimeloyl-ACP methyl ester carboxylesterase
LLLSKGAISLWAYDGLMDDRTHTNRGSEVKITGQAQIARVNGVSIAYTVQGAGVPLVLVMGYRLSSSAWPTGLIEALATRFTVVTFDNRGTGLSEKPLHGYALSNMAVDVCCLLDHLGIERAHMLGYSMGGAIAQEFALRYPARLLALILCATFCGGSKTTYAKPHILSAIRDLEGLLPEEAARRIWSVTYSPAYLRSNQQAVELQMRREIANPTPLYVADLQFQALAEFDSSSALSSINAPTLVLTGAFDQLVPPRNSRIIADLIPHAKLVVIPECGHRVMWEALDRSVSVIFDFLEDPREARADSESRESESPTVFSSALGYTPLFYWPLAAVDIATDLIDMTRRSIYFGHEHRFGDGKPVIIVPGCLANDFLLSPFAAWLAAIGYRPRIAPTSFNGGALIKIVRGTTDRVGRRAVLVALDFGILPALRVADEETSRVSEIIAIAPPQMAYPMLKNVRLHLITYRDEELHHGGITVRQLRGSFWLGLAHPDVQRALSHALYSSPIELLPESPKGD